MYAAAHHRIRSIEQMPPSSSYPMEAEIIARLRSEDEEVRLRAATELTQASTEQRRQLEGAIEPLVEMLRSGDLRCNQAALSALISLAVKNERSKIKIVAAGASEPLVGFLRSANKDLQQLAAAALLTLSAACANKPRIGAAGAIPHLVSIIAGSGSRRQSKIDAALALYDLSRHPENLHAILSAKPLPALLALIKRCIKSSRTAEKCCALVESLAKFDKGRNALADEGGGGGLLALVEVVEGGSPRGREHAVGSLLTSCKADRRRFRDMILKEGAVPGLLELTVEGTPKSRWQARALLRLLREDDDDHSPYP